MKLFYILILVRLSMYDARTLEIKGE